MTNHTQPTPQDEKPQWQPHKDWRMWLGLAITLLAVAMYVLSLDDSMLP